MQRSMIICAMILIGLVLVMREPTVAQQQADAAQKWEYKVMRDLEQARLNEFGAEGWELLTVCKTDTPHSYLFAFKRPL